MMAGPARPAHPLQTLWRADVFVFGNRIALRVVIVMRPVVELGVLCFDRLHPHTVFFNKRDAVWNEHAQHLAHRRGFEVLGHDEVNEVVDIRKARAVELVDSDCAILTGCMQCGTHCRNLGNVGIDTLHLERIVVLERRGPLRIVQSDLQDDPSFDAGGLKNLVRLLLVEGSD